MEAQASNLPKVTLWTLIQYQAVGLSNLLLTTPLHFTITCDKSTDKVRRVL